MSICPKCNAQIPEGNNFCPFCGTPAVNTVQPQQQYSQAPQQNFAPQQNYAPQQQFPAQQSFQSSFSAPPQPQKKSKKPLIIIIALILIAALAVGAYFYFSGKDDSDDGGKKDKASTSESTTLAPAKPEEAFYGTWSAEFDMTESLQKEDFYQEFSKYIEDDYKFSIYVTFEFNEDGTCNVEFDTVKLKETVNEFKDVFVHALCEYVRDNSEEFSSYTDEDIVKYMKDNGYDIEAEFEESLGEEFMQDSEFSELGKYSVEDGKLYMYESDADEDDKDDYLEYTVKSLNEIEFTKRYENGEEVVLEENSNGIMDCPFTIVKN